MKSLLHILCLVCLSRSGTAQTVNFEGAQAFVLKDQTRVVVFPAKDCEHCFYYIPTHFRISFNESKQPEVSLLKISESENDPVTGGFLHTLFTWGLDSTQDTELQQLIRSKTDSLGVLLGATTAENDTTLPGIQIKGKDELSKVIRAGLKSSSGVATTPGSKMAMSFRFDEAQMKVLQEALDNTGVKSDAVFEINLVVLVQTEWLQQRLKIGQQVKLTDLLHWLR
jgi:hypothetical protein